MVDVLGASVENNARWCHAVCACEGVVGTFEQSMWTSAARTPPLYPDAITLTRQVDVAQLVAGIETTGAGCSVKDSFADLDLSAQGFRPLFDATWITLQRPAATPSVPGFARWSTVTSQGEFERWIIAWGDSAIFRFSLDLLTDPRVRFLAGYREGELVAGAIAFDSDGVVGISNLFAPEMAQVEVWSEVAHLLLEGASGPLVGYESGDSLEAATAVGFHRTGDLTLWIT